uniref:Peptidase A2 domain-containing protein n=1 Tax=Trichuris muris TaxID=70415 RepID=A0A5S6QM60_TRIMR
MSTTRSTSVSRERFTADTGSEVSVLTVRSNSPQAIWNCMNGRIPVGVARLTLLSQRRFIPRVVRVSVCSVRPVPNRGAPAYKWFVPKELENCTRFLLRHDAYKPPPSPTYDGQFKVVTRTSKTFAMLCHDKLKTVSIDRVKPTFMESAPQPSKQRVSFGPHVEFIA